MKSYIRENRKYCGDFLSVTIYPVFTTPKSKRRKKAKPTTSVQELLNQHIAEQKITNLVNTNFTSNDYKMELTYDGDNLPDTFEQVERDIKNFFKRLRRFRRSKGLEELKYIYCIEQGTRTGRFHFHLITNGGILPQEFARIWGKGYIRECRPLQFSKLGCEELAKYYSKKLTKSGGKCSKRWRSSKNLKKPVEKVNNSKYSAKQVEILANNFEDKEIFEQLYPGYFLAEAKPFRNYHNGFMYMSIKMYRKSAKIQI